MIATPRMRNLIAAALWAGLGLPAAAEAPRVDTIRILRFGEYHDTLVRTEQVPEAATGNWRVVTDVRLLQETDTLCARLGLNFGFEYVLEGHPAGTTVQVELITRFPEPGLVNEAGRRFLVNSRPWPLTIGGYAFRSYLFEVAWEMVPGQWTFEIHHQGRKIGEKSFTIIGACPIS